MALFNNLRDQDLVLVGDQASVLPGHLLIFGVVNSVERQCGLGGAIHQPWGLNGERKGGAGVVGAGVRSFLSSQIYCE